MVRVAPVWYPSPHLAKIAFPVFLTPFLLFFQKVKEK
jgi:hypothetical protein